MLNAELVDIEKCLQGNKKYLIVVKTHAMIVGSMQNVNDVPALTALLPVFQVGDTDVYLVNIIKNLGLLIDNK